MKYIYGPVSSWRLGSSLGIDLISTREKTCTFDCIYCQLGPASRGVQGSGVERKIYVPTDEVIKEIKSLSLNTNTLVLSRRGAELQIDYITFSGRGEPTLARNLGRTIDSIKRIRGEKIAVLTNSSLMDRSDVREDLRKADFVIAKLDASREASFKLINRPMPDIKFDTILKNIKEFRKEYTKKLALQIMFTRENKDEAEKLAQLAAEIQSDEVEINTPLRPSGAKPLSEAELLGIKEYFRALNPVCVYQAPYKEVSAISHEDTLKRRGKI